MDKVEKLAHKFEKEGDKTLSFFSQLPQNCWQIKLYSDGAEWCVQEVLAHIVETEASLLRVFENIRNGGKGLANKIDIDEYNAREVAKMREFSTRELLEEFRTRRKVMSQFVSSLTEEDLRSEGNHPFLGKSTLADMLRLFYLHTNLHVRDVRARLNE